MARTFVYDPASGMLVPEETPRDTAKPDQKRPSTEAKGSTSNSKAKSMLHHSRSSFIPHPANTNASATERAPPTLEELAAMEKIYPGISRHFPQAVQSETRTTTNRDNAPMESLLDFDAASYDTSTPSISSGPGNTNNGQQNDQQTYHSSIGTKGIQMCTDNDQGSGRAYNPAAPTIGSGASMRPIARSRAPTRHPGVIPTNGVGLTASISPLVPGPAFSETSPAVVTHPASGVPQFLDPALIYSSATDSLLVPPPPAANPAPLAQTVNKRKAATQGTSDGTKKTKTGEKSANGKNNRTKYKPTAGTALYENPISGRKTKMYVGFPEPHQQLPPGLSYGDIMSRFPNHVDGALALEMYDRGIKVSDMALSASLCTGGYVSHTTYVKRIEAAMEQAQNRTWHTEKQCKWTNDRKRIVYGTLLRHYGVDHPTELIQHQSPPLIPEYRIYEQTGQPLQQTQSAQSSLLQGLPTNQSQPIAPQHQMQSLRAGEAPLEDTEAADAPEVSADQTNTSVSGSDEIESFEGGHGNYVDLSEDFLEDTDAANAPEVSEGQTTMTDFDNDIAQILQGTTRSTRRSNNPSGGEHSDNTDQGKTPTF